MKQRAIPITMCEKYNDDSDYDKKKSDSKKKPATDDSDYDDDSDYASPHRQRSLQRSLQPMTVITMTVIMMMTVTMRSPHWRSRQTNRPKPVTNNSD